jgi:hypothetical protein
MVALRWDEYSPGKLRLSPLVYPSCSIRTTKTKVAYHLIHSLRKQLLSSSTGRRHGWCCLVCSHLPAGFCDSETKQGDLTGSDARHARLSLNRTQQAQNNGRAACTQSAGKESSTLVDDSMYSPPCGPAQEPAPETAVVAFPDACSAAALCPPAEVEGCQLPASPAWILESAPREGARAACPAALLASAAAPVREAPPPRQRLALRGGAGP